jgi:hypothetical protein
MCDECYRFSSNDRPACARCAYEISSRPRRFISIAVSIVGLAAGSTWLLSRRPALWEPYGTFAWVVLAFAFATAATIAWFARAKDAPTISRRPEDQRAAELGEPTQASPYRARLHRVLPPPVPRVSATWTVIALLASLGVAALTLPRLSNLPRWLEAEIVIGAWWLAWTVILGTLLYRGFRLADDWIYYAPWDRSSAKSEDAGGASKKSKLAIDGCDPGCGSVDGEGCLFVLAIGAALLLLGGAAWVLVELAVPLVFMLAYTLLHRALRQVAHDRHGCEGRLAPSIGWGALWSGIYVAPIAAAIAVIQLAARP